MNLNPIGEILEISRFPVKSFAGERLNRVKLESYGLYGDRSHAFVDDTKDGWYRYVTARQIPEMLGYQAELDFEESHLEYPQVKITSPDGRILQWDEQLLKEIQLFSNKKISKERYSSRSEQPLATDNESILIITDRSLKKVEQIWGKTIDNRRFRANFFLSLYDDNGYKESDFIGRNFIISDTELYVKSLCERCSMITIDPETLERDPVLLDKVRENMNLNFGMYVDVARAGTIQVGDQVYLA